MQPIREQIIDCLKESGYPSLKMKELAKKLGIPQPDYRLFRSTVRQLVAEGLLVKAEGNRYAHPSRIVGNVGVFRAHRKGFGFVSILDKEVDFFIGRGELNGALDGDTVRVEKTGQWSREGLPQGYISEVVAESKKEFIGLLQRRGQHWIVDVDDADWGRDLFVNVDGIEGVVEGHRVAVKVVAREGGFRGLSGEITEVLGDPESAILDFDTVIRRYGIQERFSEEAISDARVPSELHRELKHRRDLRARTCFTIDPEKARDHDDAVGIERTNEGGYRLFVHIADVSHYVQGGTALDREAYERGCSTYLIDRVVHMLPEELAAGKCSLVPDEDRLALTVEIELGQDGQVIQSDLYESVICSRARLTYKQVQNVLDGTSSKDGEIGEWHECLGWMAELSQLRQEVRAARGSLDLDIPEAEIELDTDGEPVAVGAYPRWESNRLIEEFMLVANECVGRYCSKRNLPVLYRVHAAPSGDKVENVFKLLGNKRNYDRVDAQRIKPKDFQRLLAQAQTLPNAALYSKLLLRSLSRAEYKAEDGGHFGLGCAQYLHFTSPIRRYPDLLVHRVLKDALRDSFNYEKDRTFRDKMVEFGRQCSSLERRSEAAERTYKKIKQLRFMTRHVGDTLDGVVSGVLRSGFFVEVKTALVEGYCPAGDFDEPVIFDGERHRLVLRRSQRVVELGMSVRVVVCAVDLNAQEMDLSLSAEGNPTLLGRRQGAPRKKRKSKKLGAKSNKRKKKRNRS